MTGHDPAPASRPWFAEHRDRYLATDGEDGHDWRGVETLLLTTRGRRTGAARTLPLIYGTDGDRLLVVASKGGADRHPAWYLNLVADPDVEVQVKGDRFRARARPADAGERPALWRIMTAIWPDYDVYQTRTSRRIPVVVLERTGAVTPSAG
jgi:deazaflavin-dependent oxidoreductase (nitroreductase family)